MSLVNVDLTLLSHIVEVLLGVDTSTNRCRPGRSVDSSSLVVWRGKGLPVDQQSDRILRLLNTIVRFTRSNTLGGGSYNSSGYCATLQYPGTDINVV